MSGAGLWAAQSSPLKAKSTMAFKPPSVSIFMMSGAALEDATATFSQMCIRDRSTMLNRDLTVYFLLGFFLVGYLGLDITAVAIFAAILAVILTGLKYGCLLYTSRCV